MTIHPIFLKCQKQHPALAPSWMQFKYAGVTANNADFEETHQEGKKIPIVEKIAISHYDYGTPSSDRIDTDVINKLFRAAELRQMHKDTGLDAATCTMNERSIVQDHRFYRLAISQNTSGNAPLSTKAAILPKNVFAGQGMILSVPKRYVKKENQIDGIVEIPTARLLLSLALVNSPVVAWLTNNVFHVNSRFVFGDGIQPPVPQPQNHEIISSAVFTELVFNSLYLTLANDWDAFEGLAMQLQGHPKNIPTNDAEKYALMQRNNHLVASLYNLNTDEINQIHTQLGLRV